MVTGYLPGREQIDTDLETMYRSHTGKFAVLEDDSQSLDIPLMTLIAAYSAALTCRIAIARDARD